MPLILAEAFPSPGSVEDVSLLCLAPISKPAELAIPVAFSLSTVAVLFAHSACFGTNVSASDGTDFEGTGGGALLVPEVTFAVTPVSTLLLITGKLASVVDLSFPPLTPEPEEGPPHAQTSENSLSRDRQWANPGVLPREGVSCLRYTSVLSDFLSSPTASNLTRVNEMW